MSEELEPPVPPDCDLREFPYLQLHVRSFRDSDFVNRAPPEAVVAGWLILAASWHQVPAASVPDDDAALAQLANYGRAVKQWTKVRNHALHGFIRCSDGRLYHPFLAARARHAWEEALRFRHDRFQSTIRKHNERDKKENDKRDQLQSPSYSEWESVGRPRTIAEFKALVARDGVN